MLLDTLAASLLRSMLTDKGMNRAGEGIVGAGYGFIKKIFNSTHCLTNFEI